MCKALTDLGFSHSISVRPIDQSTLSERYDDSSQASAILIHVVGSRLAPPTRSPSISGAAISVDAFPTLTLPPYRIGISLPRVPIIEISSERSKVCIAEASVGVAVSPVPIAHTGSYARRKSVVIRRGT